MQGNNTPKVSILVPAYNVEQYIVQAMDSLVKQTLEDIQIVCINDGSTDRTLEYLNKYAEKDDRVLVIDKENGGYGVGMNVALDHATGEYIGILEPDDYVPVRMFEDLYNKAKENDLDFIKADFYRFAEEGNNGNIKYTYFHLSKNPNDYNVVFNPSEKPEATRYEMNTWSGIYKRSFLLEHGIRHHETPGASFQDNGFFFQTFAFAKRAMIVDTPYYLNRRDNPNSSVKNKGKVYAMNVEYDYIRRIMVKHPETWERFKGSYWYKKLQGYMMTLNRIDDSFKPEYVYRISEEFRWGLTKQEFGKNDFSDNEWKIITTLINDPERYMAERGFR